MCEGSHLRGMKSTSPGPSIAWSRVSTGLGLGLGLGLGGLGLGFRYRVGLGLGLGFALTSVYVAPANAG